MVRSTYLLKIGERVLIAIFCNDFLTLMKPDLWRHPDRPVIQILLPYFFISDEVLFYDTVAPFFLIIVHPNGLDFLFLVGFQFKIGLG